MEVFRISIEKYSGKLTSSGRANRWNQDNEFVIYTGSSRSLATLELVVHLSQVKPSLKYKVMVISIADDDFLYNQFLQNDLPSDWRSMNAYSNLQTLGSSWYNANSSLVLKVPSAIIPKEYNYLINTKHPDYNDHNVSLVRIEDYFWDERLFG